MALLIASAMSSLSGRSAKKSYFAFSGSLIAPAAAKSSFVASRFCPVLGFTGRFSSTCTFASS